jgi:hypothetical protein
VGQVMLATRAYWLMHIALFQETTFRGRNKDCSNFVLSSLAIAHQIRQPRQVVERPQAVGKPGCDRGCRLDGLMFATEICSA